MRPKDKWKALIDWDSVALRDDPHRMTLPAKILGTHKENGREIEMDFLSKADVLKAMRVLEYWLELYGDYLPDDMSDVDKANALVYGVTRTTKPNPPKRKRRNGNLNSHT